MKAAPLSIFLAAGEASGDALAADLMAALRAAHGGEVVFSGVGGPRMAAEGLESLFPQSELEVMGLVEVVPAIPRLLRRIGQTAGACIAARPDALVTVDSPDFGLRVARKVHAAAPEIATLHYAAPSVWAWRPGRAKTMAGYLDRVLALYPFEPEWFERYGLRCDFVGHPVTRRLPARETLDPEGFRAEIGAGDAPLLLILPGSRRGEVARLAGPMGEVARRLAGEIEGLRIVVPAAPGVADPVLAAVEAWGVDALALDPRGLSPAEAERRKFRAFAAADAAFAASGTVSLELAASGAPMVTVYRTAWLTSAIVRRLVRVDTANLVNLILGEKAAPEFLQEYFTPEAAIGALRPLLTSPEARATQRAALARCMAALGAGAEAPADRAARAVLEDVALKRG